MVLSNGEILNLVKKGYIKIEPLSVTDPSQPPFNTSAVDLCLGNEIAVPNTPDGVKGNRRGLIDPFRQDVKHFLVNNSQTEVISDDRPYCLQPNKFILGQTKERVDFPILDGNTCYSARVEGKSSLARLGLLVHFTAPTIHSGFNGRIALEIINLGPFDILLSPEMPICQLIVEEVKGTPAQTPTSFKGQDSPTGKKS